MKKRTHTFLITAIVAFLATTANAQVKPPAAIEALLSKHTCLVCHKVETRLIGPAYIEVAKKKYTPEKMVELIYKPKPENWPGYPPMAAMPNVPKAEALKIAKWINSLAKK